MQFKTYFFLLSLILACDLQILATDLQASEKDIQAKEAVKNLWSSTDEERLVAKKHLLELKETSIPYLVALLNDLTNDRRPRFATGKEAEGEEALKTTFQSPSAIGFETHFAALKKVNSLNIKTRLRKDAFEILVSLEAKSALASLINKWLWELYKSIDLGEEKFLAIVDLGVAAIPLLADEIETVNEKVKQHVAGKSVSIETEKDATAMLLLRAIDALGRIGDESALPILAKIKSEDSQTRYYVEQAVKKIFEKPKESRRSN